MTCIEILAHSSTSAKSKANELTLGTLRTSHDVHGGLKLGSWGQLERRGGGCSLMRPKGDKVKSPHFEPLDRGEEIDRKAEGARKTSVTTHFPV